MELAVPCRPLVAISRTSFSGYVQSSTMKPNRFALSSDCVSPAEYSVLNLQGFFFFFTIWLLARITECRHSLAAHRKHCCDCCFFFFFSVTFANTGVA